MTDRPDAISSADPDDVTDARAATDVAPEQPERDSAGGAPDAAAPRRLCPYLVGREGDWRAAMPIRDHRCAAVDPPAALSVMKQRRLCLGPDHRSCATYLAARRALVPIAEGDADPGLESGRRPTRWPLPRTAPVLLERDRGAWLADPRTRSLGQLALVVLMAAAFLALIVARSGDRDGEPAASVEPSPNGSPVGSVAPSSSPQASSSAGGPTAAPSPSPIAEAPSPSAVGTTYVVLSGDTLSAIAARFGTTVDALVEANDIADPGAIRVGRTLVIP